jgi:hypothetical protein
MPPAEALAALRDGGLAHRGLSAQDHVPRLHPARQDVLHRPAPGVHRHRDRHGEALAHDARAADRRRRGEAPSALSACAAFPAGLGDRAGVQPLRRRHLSRRVPLGSAPDGRAAQRTGRRLRLSRRRGRGLKRPGDPRSPGRRDELLSVRPLHSRSPARDTASLTADRALDDFGFPFTRAIAFTGLERISGVAVHGSCLSGAQRSFLVG